MQDKAPGLDGSARRERCSRRIPLLGGYVDGRGHRLSDVELTPLNGRDETKLQELDGRTPLASVVTVLLARALRRLGTIARPSPEIVRELLVGDRDYLVLKLYELTLGPSLWITLACKLEGCGKPMDIKLDLSALPFEERPVSSRYFELDGGPRFRLPNGGDQEVASRLFSEDPKAAVRTMLERCLDVDDSIRPTLPRPEALDITLGSAIEARMQELAPALDIELEAACPECGGPFGGRLDLMPRLVGELCGSAPRLEHEVHVIAWNYHWSEREILALPRSKRRRYVQLIDRQHELASA